MIGDIRKLIESSDVDYLFHNYSSIFNVFGENFSLFAYQFYFFHNVQKSQNMESMSQLEERNGEINLRRVHKLDENIRILHITHENYWSFKGSDAVERTMSNFNLNYSNRHFYSENHSGRHEVCDIDILKAPFNSQQLCNNVYDFVRLVAWSFVFLFSVINLNRSLLARGLPNFPKLHFIVKLLLLKYYANKVEFNLQKNTYSEVCFSSYYSLKSLAICFASKRYGINTVNLQHGIQGPKHPAFNFRAYINDSLPSYVPSVFCCYFLENDHNIVHPEIQLERKKFSVKNLRKRKIKRVLVTLQPSFTLSDDLIRGLKKLAMLDILVSLKLHPRANPQRLLMGQLEKFSNISVIQGDVNVKEVLCKTDVHITGFSSSAIDAAQLGVKTFFLDKRAVVLYPSLLEERLAELAVSSTELMNRILVDG